MPMHKEDYEISETGNWNVADDYSHLKIMKPLALADEYETIAYFGTSSLIEEYQLQITNKDQLKINAFERLVNTLILLINNSLFAIKKVDDKTTLEEHKKTLEKIQNLIPSLYKIKKDYVKKSQTTTIELEKYNKVLRIVSEVKSNINIPLNNSHLIFTNKEEYDPKKAKERYMADAMSHG